MKKIIIVLSFFFGNTYSTSAQTLGTKKTLVLELTSIQCGDFCYLETKDVKTGKSYTLTDMMDEKTNDHGVIDEIQEIYWADGDDSRLQGSSYVVVIEYRKTDEYIIDSIEEPARKTGRKLTKWMVNSISKKQG